MTTPAQPLLFQHPMVPARDHALPFRVLLHEYLERYSADQPSQPGQTLNEKQKNVLVALLKAADLTFDGREVPERLEQMLREQEQAYQSLQDAKLKPAILDISKLQEACSKADVPLKKLLHAMDRSALCFSGGGIRSASFCLGVLQGLARFSQGALPEQRRDSPLENGLLQRIDFLSTVSGGGYIGSWWSAWITRWAKARTPKDHQTSAEHFKEAHQAVIEALAGESKETAGDPAPQPVRHLREYTSYLAPALGLSLDTWTLAAIVLRNLAVNWLMLLPVLLAAVALPQVARWAVYVLDPANPANRETYKAWWYLITLALLVLLFVVSAYAARQWLPSHYGQRKNDKEEGRVKKNKKENENNKDEKEGKGSKRRAREDVQDSQGAGPLLVFLFFLGPLFLATWLLLLTWQFGENRRFGQEWVYLTALGFVSFGVLSLGTWRIYRRKTEEIRSKRLKVSLMRQPPIVALILFVETLFIAVSSGWFVARIDSWLVSLSSLRPSIPFVRDIAANGGLFILFSLPIVWGTLILASSLFSGMIGIYELEEDREWWARAGGMMLMIIVGWMAALAVALSAKSLFPALVGLILGAIGSAIGFSGTTSAGPRPVKAAQLTKFGKFLQKHNLLLPGLCALAILFITGGVASMEEQLRKLLTDSLCWNDFNSALCVFVIAAVVALLLNLAININVFSLHGMYRMRLMRAFLGASNTKRMPDKFTKFAADDSPYLHELAKSGSAPLHIINTTLNEVGTKNLAWRQRKAQSFTFSPVSCGGWRVGYVETRNYAGSEGVKLATAMAISGAAFNPNMGYHSSPLVTLLMTLFNARLGWWLPNPKRAFNPKWWRASRGVDFLRKPGPTFALEPLLREALGQTDDEYRWIELTDGGHFENLGLYEMILRRCKNIIVVDAGADPDCQFEDLGNALRKIEIDLGVPIRFDSELKMKGAQTDNRYCAVASIDYACVDGACAQVEDADGNHRSDPEKVQRLQGALVYIKASLTGREPPDIRQYSLTHKDFPHETTANQFFNESQFESYRHLGSVILETLVEEGVAAQRKQDPKWTPDTNTKSFTQTAKAYAGALGSPTRPFWFFGGEESI